MKLKEIAAGITAHLKRFEADPAINAVNPKTNLPPFWHARAYLGGSRVGVVYVSFQGATCLTKGEALRYLAWLDAGNVGRHFEFFHGLGGGN